MKTRITPSLPLALAAAAFLAWPLQAQSPAPIPSGPAARKEYVAKLIATAQKTDASLIDRFAACRELSRLGDASAVPVLAALLCDDQMSHMARYGLEPNPDPSVDDALRATLDKVKGNLLLGVVDSIGLRRDAKAVGALAALLASPDGAVASAAACSLGRIGNADAAAVLEKALAGASGSNLTAIADGCIRAADALCAGGKRDVATGIYDRVRASQAPQPVRMAAAHGALLARGNEGIPALIEQLKGGDNAMAAVALRATYEMNATELTQALAAELPKLSSDRQVQVLQALGNRKDTSAMPAVIAAAKTGPTATRVAAVRAACQIACPSCLPTLTALCQDAEPEVSTAAQAGLSGFPGKEAGAAVVKLMDAPEAKVRCLAIDMAGQRRMASALPALLKSAQDADKQVSSTSFKVLGELAGAADIPALINLVVQSPSPSAENALSAVCARQNEQPSGSMASVEALCSAMGQAPVPAKQALLRILRSAGGPKALATVQAAMNDANADVKDTATRVLCDWTTPDAADKQLTLAKTSANPTYQVLALRGYIRSMGDVNLAAGQRQAMCKEATALIQRDPEKKLLLAALGNAGDADSLAMVISYLSDPATKEEASAAAVAIAERLLAKNPAAVADSLKAVVKATQNPEILKRAHRAFAQTRPKPAAK